MLGSVSVLRGVASALWRSGAHIPEGTPFSCWAGASGGLRLLNVKQNTLKHPASLGVVGTLPAASVCTSISFKGLEEFFPRTDDILEEGERTGMNVLSWTI